MTLQYKMNETGDGIAINDKGLPLIVDEKGQEIGLDAIHLYSKVPVLQNQVKQHKESYEKVIPMVRLLEDSGLDQDTLPDWMTSAKKAIETVKNLDDKSLVDAGTVEKLKQQAQEEIRSQFSAAEKGMKAQLEAMKAEKERLMAEKEKQTAILHSKEIADHFNTSPFIQKQAALSPLIMRQLFANNFQVEQNELGELQIVGYNKGEKIYSRERAGELASFDEAMEILVKQHPDSDRLIIGNAQSGTGATGNRTSSGSGKKSLEEMYEDAVKRHDTVAQIAIKRQLAIARNQSQ